jgi:hypothetical protein
VQLIAKLKNLHTLNLWGCKGISMQIIFTRFSFGFVIFVVGFFFFFFTFILDLNSFFFFFCIFVVPD